MSEHSPFNHHAARTGPRALWRHFLAANRAISQRLDAHLPQAREDLNERYEDAAAELMNSLPPEATIVDVGGGRRCHYAHRRSPGSGARIVAVDVSEEELAQNRDADETIVADAMRGLPFPEASVDVITSRAVLEHFRNSEDFVESCAAALKPGGHLLALFSSKFAPHSIANQLLPDTASRFLLHALVPDSRGRLGFPAYYDRTYYSKFREILERHGFELTRVSVSYYQSPYFAFFVPLFVLSALYELVVYRLGAKNLAATVVVLARKRDV